MALIIDLTRMMAGPFATQVLGDLGHDVIKVEQEHVGDATRRNPPYVKGVSAYFFSANRNKKSIIIDLKKPEGRDLLLDLVRRADVVIENFRPGVMESLRLGYDELRRARPDIIHVSINGFGSWGPLRDKLSFDAVALATGGAYAATTPDEGEPIKPAIAMGDYGVALIGALAVVRALLERRHTGRGRHLEVSLLDVVLAFSGPVGENVLLNGELEGGTSTPVPSGVYATADGHIALSAFTDEAWAALCAVPEFAALDLPEFRDSDGRARHRERLEKELAAQLGTRTTDEWLRRLPAADVVGTAVAGLREVVADRGLTTRGMLPLIPHPVIGGLQTMGNPIRREPAPHRETVLPPPRHGEHTLEILEDLLGLGEDEIDALLDRQIVSGLVPEKL